jgi:hypothetical protein
VSLFVLNHFREEFFNSVQDRDRVDVDSALDHGVSEFQGGFAAHDSCVVDQDLNRSKGSSGGLSRLDDGILFGHVTLKYANVRFFDSSLDHELFSLLQALDVNVGERHFAAHLAEPDSHEPADTAASTCQEDMLSRDLLFKECQAVLSGERLQAS